MWVNHLFFFEGKEVEGIHSSGGEGEKLSFQMHIFLLGFL